MLWTHHRWNRPKKSGRNRYRSSTELSTNGHQDPNPTQPKHSGNDRFDPKREIVPNGSVEPLIVEKYDEGREDAEEIHYRYYLLG
jgi:hypothetical protein